MSTTFTHPAARTISLGPTTPTRSVEEVRASLGEKLDELHRRATHARRVLSPVTYLANPWVRAGIACAIGLAWLDRRGKSHESLLHAVVRSGLMAATTVLVTRALTEPSQNR